MDRKLLNRGRAAHLVLISCWFTLNCGQPVVGSRTNTKPGTDVAVYIQHVGISDKPILATVICLVNPSRIEMEEILGRDGARDAIVFEVSSKLFDQIRLAVTRNTKSDEPPNPQMQYGTFRFSIVGRDSRVEKTLPPIVSRTLISELEGICAEEQAKLRSHLEGTLKRLKSPKNERVARRPGTLP